MEDLNSTMERCANCSYSFTDESSKSNRTKSVELVIEASQVGSGALGSTSKVTIAEALALVHNITSTEPGAALALCSDCAQPLTRAYIEVKKLSQLRAGDSYVSQQLSLREDLLNENYQEPSPKAPPKRSKALKGKSAKKSRAKKAPNVLTKITQPKKEPKEKKARKPKVTKVPDMSAFWFNGTSDRPSRSAKLTAMVLMTNSWDKEPLYEPPQIESTKPEKSVKSEAAPKKRKASGTNSTKAPKKAKVEPVPEEPIKGVKSPEVLPSKNKGKKNKKTPLILNASKSTSISPPSYRPVKVPEKEITPEPPKIAEPPQKKHKGRTKDRNETENARKERKIEKKNKIKAKILLPKVFKKINTESAADRKKLEAKVVTDKKRSEVQNSGPEQARALDLTTKMTPPKNSEGGGTGNVGPPVGKTGKKNPKPVKALSVLDVPMVKSKENTPNNKELTQEKNKPVVNSLEEKPEKEKKKNKSGKEEEKKDKIPEKIKVPEKIPENKTSGEEKEKKFACKACDKHFSARWNLRRHELLVHELSSGSPPFPCPHCSQVFEAKAAIFEHRMSGPCSNSIGSPVQTPKETTTKVQLTPPEKPEPTKAKKKNVNGEKLPESKPKAKLEDKIAPKRKSPGDPPPESKPRKEANTSSDSVTSSVGSQKSPPKTKQDAINQLFDSVKAAAEAKKAEEKQSPTSSSVSGSKSNIASRDPGSSSKTSSGTIPDSDSAKALPPGNSSSSHSSSSSNSSNVNANPSLASPAEAGNPVPGPAVENSTNGAGVGA